MEEKYYFGNTLQIRGVEEYRLTEGKAAGMRMLQVRNGLGLEVTVSPERCADIARVIYKGDNLGYFSPTGHVAPAYYDGVGDGMLRSFTGGFLTTCGLTNVGVPCEDAGEALPLHGRISNQPAEHCWWTEEADEFVIHAKMRQGAMFQEKLELHRRIRIGKKKNQIKIEDCIRNCGEQETPCMILYHMNMGYPLLTEHAKLTIPSVRVEGRNELAKEYLESWDQIIEPGSMKEEVCYYHSFEKDGFARIYNPDLKKGVEIRFDAESLNCFVEWKMMGKYDYVLGLEPGNCYPNGRKAERERGALVTLPEGGEKHYAVEIQIVEE